MKIKNKITSNNNGILRYKKVYVDEQREYDLVKGKKKKEILDSYSLASQINIVIDTILSGDDSKLIELSNNIKKILNEGK